MNDGIYESAVKGRRDFRAAYRAEREECRKLREVINTLVTAINPADRGGISMHDWNERLKAATATAKAAVPFAESVA